MAGAEKQINNDDDKTPSHLRSRLCGGVIGATARSLARSETGFAAAADVISLARRLQELIWFFSPAFTENTEASFVTGATKRLRQKIMGE